MHMCETAYFHKWIERVYVLRWLLGNNASTKEGIRRITAIKYRLIKDITTLITLTFKPIFKPLKVVVPCCWFEGF